MPDAPRTPAPRQRRRAERVPRTFTVEVPLPPVGCAQNSRSKWGTVRATAAYREECKLAFLAAGIPSLRTPVTIDLTSWHGGRGTKDGRYRSEDQTNFLGACKALFDSLQDAGVIESDTYDNLRIGHVVLMRRLAEHKGKAGVVVTITEAKENEP